jgi:hypothetical protein
VVYAVDTFPYLVLSGQDLAECHVSDVARQLRPGGALLVLNYSYSGGLEHDRRQVAALARISDLPVVCDGTRDFKTWYAAAFQMVRARRLLGFLDYATATWVNAAVPPMVSAATARGAVGTTKRRTNA